MTDIEERTKLYQEAERILTEDAGFIWIVHRTPLNLWKPYIKGEGMAPGQVNTNPGFAWPGASNMNGNSSTMYIGKEVTDYRKELPQ